MYRLFRSLKSDSKGATAIEYGLIAALIVIAMMGSLNYLAGRTSRMWINVANEVNKS